ncbi:MAG: dienelactone hydrolase family protein [Polyangiaceae bacterium]|nr:dienelactone hydrolase family protein [Polyangiaceae bacterium]
MFRAPSILPLLTSISFLAIPTLIAHCGSTTTAAPGWNDAGYDNFDGGFTFADASFEDDAAGPQGPAISFPPNETPATTSCAKAAKDPGASLWSLNSSGGLRTGWTYIPKSYDPTKPTMIVLNFHGFTSDATQQLGIARMNPTAEKEGFIAVYPQGLGNAWNAGDCCSKLPVDDVKFARDLVAKLREDYCVDDARIFATGFSNGGFFSYKLACEMSDVIAAVAPVAGVMGMDPKTLCKPTRPVPVLHFHGTSDPVVKYLGGTPVVPLLNTGLLKFRSAEESVEFWRTENKCLSPEKTQYQNGDVRCREWSNCQNDANVTLCTIDGGGHAWPSGVPMPFILGKTTTDISATDTMVSFFRAHPKP